MSSARGLGPFLYRPVARRDLACLHQLEFDPIQLERYLGSVDDIIAMVRRGPAHRTVAIDEGEAFIGFYAVHPDRRDAACWWLGWFGIDRRHQGGGRGRRIVADIIARLRRLPNCREVRLLVAPENAAAMRLYRRAGFVLHGVSRATGEWIMRLLLPPSRPSGTVPARFWANAILMEVVQARICRMGVPVAAQLHGEVAFPP